MKIKHLKDLLKKIEHGELESSQDDPLEISLKNEIITRSEMELIVAALKNEKLVLHTLSFQNCGLDDQDVINLMQALGSQPRHLEILNFSDNRIGKEGAIGIAKALEGKGENTQQIGIENLLLNNTEIEDEGMEAIAKAIVTAEAALNANVALNDSGLVNEEITNLECKGNKLTIKGVVAAIDILKSKKQFKFNVPINFDGTVEQVREGDNQVTKAIKGAAQNVAEAWYKSNNRHDADFQIAVDPVYKATESRLGEHIITNSSERECHDEYNSYRDKLEEKINFLRQKYGQDKKSAKFFEALEELSKSINADITAQLSNPSVDLDFEAAKKISQSSAMVVLRATDKMLEKVFKEDRDPELAITGLKEYLGDCQQAAQWTVWQKVVAAVVIGVLGCLSMVCSGVAGMAGIWLEMADNDPLNALHLAEKALKAELPEGTVAGKMTFFAPLYSHLISKVAKEIPQPDDSKTSKDSSNESSKENPRI